jgi:hypothetical protein
MPRTAWAIRCSFSTSAKRTWPSPSAPKPLPGASQMSGKPMRLIAEAVIATLAPRER